MKHPNTDITLFGKQILNVTGNVTTSILDGVKDILDKSMTWTAEIFIQRCEVFQKNPPPSNWSGVFHMETK